MAQLVRLLPPEERVPFQKGRDKARSDWCRAPKSFVYRRIVSLFYTESTPGFPFLGGVY